MSDSIIPQNKVKQALKNGQTVVGTMVAEIRQPAVMQLLANAGFDFAIIDNEHGPFNIETIADLSRTARYVGLTPFVRVPDLAYPYIAQSLDAGAQGIMLPRVVSVEQVKQAVDMLRYPPQGSRGCAVARGHTNFNVGSPAEIMAKINDEVMLIVQIETKEAADNIDRIVSVPGVDIALIGPTDLSIALGVPGQLDSSVLHAAMQKMIDVCQQRNVYPALHINNLEWAVHWVNKGMRLLSSMSEAGLLMNGGRAVTSVIKEAAGR